jgi:hypothetical protein
LKIALAVALVAAAGLLIRSLMQLQRVDPGFRTENVLAMSFDFTAGPFRGPGNQQPYFHELMMRIASLPGTDGSTTTARICCGMAWGWENMASCLILRGIAA